MVCNSLALLYAEFAALQSVPVFKLLSYVMHTNQRVTTQAKQPRNALYTEACPIPIPQIYTLSKYIYTAIHVLLGHWKTNLFFNKNCVEYSCCIIVYYKEELNDVWMTVPKTREIRAVYIQQGKE